MITTDQSKLMTDLASAIIEKYGNRCIDFDADCLTCQSWAIYDRLYAVFNK